MSTDKQEKNKKKSNGKHLFKKGESGNPSGRPKKGYAWADVYNNILEINLSLKFNGEKRQIDISSEPKQKMRYILGLSLLEQGLLGNVKAIQELADRTEGKPRDKVEITDEENNRTFTVTFDD